MDRMSEPTDRANDETVNVVDAHPDIPTERGTMTVASGPISPHPAFDLSRLIKIEITARNVLYALHAYQDGLVAGNVPLEPLYLRWLAAVQALEVALR